MRRRFLAVSFVAELNRILQSLSAPSYHLILNHFYSAFTDKHEMKRKPPSKPKVSFEETSGDESSSGMLCFYSQFVSAFNLGNISL